MSNKYTINIRNMSDTKVHFYSYQAQAAFDNSGSASDVYSCSLATASLASYASSGAQLTFTFDAQVYAGSKQENPGQNALSVQGSFEISDAALIRSESWAKQKISLTPGDGGGEVNNHTDLSVNPLGLSQPVWNGSVQEGDFGVTVPVFTQVPGAEVYCGNACVLDNSSIVLSSFMAPVPNSEVSCAPVAKYYVKMGSYASGTVVSYSTAGAAKCDFSKGVGTYLVEYQSDGSFTVSAK